MCTWKIKLNDPKHSLPGSHLICQRTHYLSCSLPVWQQNTLDVVLKWSIPSFTWPPPTGPKQLYKNRVESVCSVSLHLRLFYFSIFFFFAFQLWPSGGGSVGPRYYAHGWLLFSFPSSNHHDIVQASDITAKSAALRWFTTRLNSFPFLFLHIIVVFLFLPSWTFFNGFVFSLSVFRQYFFRV